MPDLGQHSTGWCWVGAAANSFWWYAYHGHPGLLGGGSAPYPWEAINTDSTNPVSVCGAGGTWYDDRDGPPDPNDGSTVAGYPTLLKMIAQTTFRDKVQDGVQDPDGADNTAGTIDDEVNYCFSEGVEKWDYLVGLRDFVNNHGSGLRVHDIIDQTRCAPTTGWLPNRTTPGKNAFAACGVPGIEQEVRTPTLLDYQTELSRGQDVLLWMEPTTGYPEYAHVVTGVGYAAGVVTISDPWTHTTNVVPPPPPPPLPAPSALHNDGLLAPWQSIPDHNTVGTQGATDPYNACVVVSANPFQINCPNEDTGVAISWTVYDMIFVSPAGVGGIAELPDVSNSSGRNYVALAGLTAAALVALAAGAWLARRRWER
jgi:hypothetical protein